MNVVVLQPSYVPWRGYFHLVHRADVFVFYDDVQYDKHGWRNRNRIKTATGSQWLTIPVLSKGNTESGLPIHEARISLAEKWQKKHLMGIKQSYGRSPFFEPYRELVESFYAQTPALLADFTIATTQQLAAALGITGTTFLRSSELALQGAKNDRLLALLQKVGATHCISGPSAKAYIDEAAFAAANITLEYQVYDYPEYEQLYPPFDPQVTVLDLLFMKGPAAGEYIWGAETKR